MRFLRRAWVPLACLSLGESLVLGLFLVPLIRHGPSREWETIQYHVGRGPRTGSIGDRLTVMTWNLARGRGPGYPAPDLDLREMRRILDDLVGVVAEVRPDVLVLQECDREAPDSFGISFDREIAERAFGDAAVAFGPNYDTRLGAWRWVTGNAIVSRFPIEASGLVPFEGYSGIRRRYVGAKALLWAVVGTPGTAVTVLDVHLNAYRRDQREREFAEVLRRIPRGGPSIVAGDFNAPPGDLGALADHGLAGVPPDESVRTFHSRRPDRTIDHLFAPVAPIEWLVLDVEASDHRPVVAVYPAGLGE